jgi:hypothetical protein
MIKGVLRGSCRIQLPSGLVIQDAAGFVGRRRARANLPAQGWIGQDYRQKTDANGKPAYLPGLADHFSEAVVALIGGGPTGRTRRRAGLAEIAARAAARSSHTVMMVGSNVPERRRIGASR